jgi:hypothetical protein
MIQPYKTYTIANSLDISSNAHPRSLQSPESHGYGAQTH